VLTFSGTPENYLTHLVCSECGTKVDAHQIQTYCQACQAPYVAVYDLTRAAERLDRDRLEVLPGMWRWFPLLPVQEVGHIITLGEGNTPLLRLTNLAKDWELEGLFLKDESSNPTGSFKARGMAASVSRAKELGVHRLVIPTAGNAGGAMAAYAARAGMKACIFMPEDTPRPIVEECRITGAEVTLVDGLISDAGRLAGQLARQEGWFDLSTFKEPYRLEGKKIMGYELAEAFAWRLPDVLLYPTGGGTGLVGIWKAFLELEALGWLESSQKPRMVAIQAEGCAPVVKAFHIQAERCDPWPDAETIAAGLRVPRPFADRMILRALRESEGEALAVSDAQIRSAQRLLAGREGIFAAPEGAATLAGLQKLLAEGKIRKNERVVLLNTGSGLKYL